MPFSNKYLFPRKSFTSLLRFFSKNYFDGISKHEGLTNIVDSYINLVLKQANKISILANRNKLNFYDLVNSINESILFPFKLSRPDNYRIFQKKILINCMNKCVYPNTAFEKIVKKFQNPRVFQKWVQLPSKKVIRKGVHNLKKITGQVFEHVSFNEALFLSYSFNTIYNKKIFERNLCLKILSGNHNFRASHDYFFFYAVYFILKNQSTKKVLIGLRVIQAIALKNPFSIHYKKKIVSILIDLILKKIFIKNCEADVKLTLYSFGILKNVEQVAFNTLYFF